MIVDLFHLKVMENGNGVKTAFPLAVLFYSIATFDLCSCEETIYE